MDFHHDYEGLGALLRTSPELQATLLAAAEHGVEVVRAIAPVGTPPDDRHPGEYRDALHAELGMGPKKDRLGARIVAGAPHSAAVEWGNAHAPAHHTLQKGLELLGGD